VCHYAVAGTLATKAPARNREAETALARKHAAEQYAQSNQ